MKDRWWVGWAWAEILKNCGEVGEAIRTVDNMGDFVTGARIDIEGPKRGKENCWCDTAKVTLLHIETALGSRAWHQPKHGKGKLWMGCRWKKRGTSIPDATVGV